MVRTYAYSVHLEPLKTMWETGDAAALAARLAECDEEAGVEAAELQALIERARAGQQLEAEAQTLLEESLAVYLGECLEGEPLTDVDFFSGAYEELAETLAEAKRLSEWEQRAILTWGVGRGWGEALPELGARRRPGGYYWQEELPRVKDAFRAAERALRGAEREAYRPLIEEALVVLDTAIEAGRDLALRLA